MYDFLLHTAHDSHKNRQPCHKPAETRTVCAAQILRTCRGKSICTIYELFSHNYIMRQSQLLLFFYKMHREPADLVFQVDRRRLSVFYLCGIHIEFNALALQILYRFVHIRGPHRNVAVLPEIRRLHRLDSVPANTELLPTFFVNPKISSNLCATEHASSSFSQLMPTCFNTNPTLLTGSFLITSSL